MSADRASADRFYEAAIVALHALELRQPTGRRFGPNADAMWKGFRGELRDEDRLDLLIRDAAVTQPAAFAPRLIFGLDGLAADEPYGPEWPGLEPALALRLLRARSPDVSAMSRALGAVAAAWGLQPKKQGRPSDLSPASKFTLSGASAIIAVAEHFDGKKELDLADQATLIADAPGERQLFGVAVALLDGQRQVHVLTEAAAPKARLPERRIE